LPEIKTMLAQLDKRVTALESPTETGKRRAQSLEEVQLFFAKVGLTKEDGAWFWSKMICSGWRNNGKVVRSWQHCVTAWKLANIFPSQKNKTNGHSIFELKTVLGAKKEEAKTLIARSYNDSGAFHEWTNEPDRQRYIVVKREIINLTAKIGQSA